MPSRDPSSSQAQEPAAPRRMPPRPDVPSYRQGLEPAYLHQVGSFDRLSLEEERHFTLQFSQARSKVNDILHRFPAIILHQLRHLNAIKHDIRIVNFIDLSGDAEGERSDADIRIVLSQVLDRLERLIADQPNPDESLRAPSPAFAAAFEEALSPLALRDSFHAACLRLVEQPDERRQMVDDSLWERHREELARWSQLLQEAHSALVERNLRLVISIAQNYARDTVSIQDLIQEGNIGLMRAVEKFDPTKGHRLSTYASYWIRQFITRSLTNHSRTIRISSSTLKLLNQVRRCERELRRANGAPPEPEDIAEFAGMSVPKVRALLRMAQQPISLQAAISENAELADMIADNTSPCPEEEAARHVLRSSIVKAMDCLEERERYIIAHRYGLNDAPMRTLAQLSQELGLSSERIRQLENSAMRKLRSKEATQFLDGYQ